MATREIKTRFRLEGESEYNSAMQRVSSSMKVLSSEQKLAKAQFEATGDQQKYAAEQARILKEKIEEQKKAVEAAEQALKKLKSYGLEPSDQLTQKWTAKLNNAKTSLQNMENQLAGLSGGLSETSADMEQAGNAAGELDSALRDMGKGITLQNAVSAIDSITGHIEGVIRTAGRAAKAIWDMGVDAGAWADDVATRAAQMGIDPETYQSWQYASRFIDTSVEDIAKSWQDFDKKLKDPGSKTSLDWMANLAQMGIATMTTAGQMRTSKDIFWDAVDYLHGIGDEATRAQQATLLFGNDWRSLNPLIDAGSDAYKAMAEQGREVAVVSNENVAALGSVDDAMQDFGARFDKLKYDALAALAPTFEKVAVAMSTAVTALDEFVQSEEGQQALANLNEALSGVINSFLGEDGGKGKFSEIVGDAQKAVEGFTGAMQWIQDNGETVKGTIIGLAGAWAGLKATKEVLLFMALLKAAGGGAGSLFGSAAKASGADVAGEAAKAGGAALAGKAAKTAKDAASSGSEAAKEAAEAIPGARTASRIGGALGTAMRFISDAAAKLGGPLLGIGGEAAALKGVADFDAARRAKLDAQTTERTEEIRALSDSAGDMGETVRRLSDILRGAMTRDEEKKDIFGHASQDPQAYKRALDEIAQMDTGGVFSGRTQGLLYRYSHPDEWGFGLDESEQWDLLDDMLKELKDYAQNGGKAAESFDSTAEAVQAINEALESGDYGKMDETLEKVAASRDIFSKLSEDAKNLTGQRFDPLSSFNIQNENGSGAKIVLQTILDELEGAQTQAQTAGENTAASYATGIAAGAGEASTQADAMAANAAASADRSDDFYTIGGNLDAGLVSGMYARAGEVAEAGAYLGSLAAMGARSSLAVASPSRVFKRIGAFTAMGFAEGIEESSADVERAVGRMISATQRPVQAMRMDGAGAYAREAQRGDGAQRSRGEVEPGRVHVTMMIDKQVLGEVEAPIINGIIGAQIEATRR